LSPTPVPDPGCACCGRYHQLDRLLRARDFRDREFDRFGGLGNRGHDVARSIKRDAHLVKSRVGVLDFETHPVGILPHVNEFVPVASGTPADPNHHHLPFETNLRCALIQVQV